MTSGINSRPGDGEGSVTRWIAGVKAGDLAAAQPLWERYFARMVDLARARLRAAGRRGHDAASDEEDAALSAFDSLLRRPGPGAVPATGRPRRPLAAPGRHHHAEGPAPRPAAGSARSAAAARSRPACDVDDPDSDDDVLARAVGSEPTPEFAAMVAEEYRRLLDRLGDDVLRKVAILRMEGYTTDAIADRLGCARRTVARQLALIRRILASDPDRNPS